MSYDHRTRRKAKVKNLKMFMGSATAVAAVLVCTAIFSLKTYVEFPIPQQIRSLFGTSDNGEFSQRKISGIALAIQKNPLNAKLPSRLQSWTLLPNVDSSVRESRIRELFKHEKSITVDFHANVPLAKVRERVNPRSSVFTERNGLLLLPGETLRFAPNIFTSANPTLAVRCLGVTPDKQDAKIAINVTSDATSVQEISVPLKNDVLEFAITKTEGENTIAIHWPENAPGVLEILGELVSQSPATPPVIFISIDNLGNGLSSLKKTWTTLQKHDPTVQNVSQFWPTSSHHQSALSSIFSGQIPSNLGITIPTEVFPKLNPVSNFQTLELHFAKQFYKTLRVKIRSPNTCEECFHHPQLDSILGLSNFDLHIDVQRKHELREGIQAVFRDFDGQLNGMFLHLSIELEAKQISYTWESALSPDASVFSWIRASWFGDDDQSTIHNREKEAQIDAALSEVLLKIQAFNPTARIVVLATSTNKTQEAKTAQTPLEDVPTKFGEAWIPRSMLTPNLPTLASQLSLFGALNDFEKPQIEDTSIAPIQTPFEEIFVTPHGWMSIPVVTFNNVPSNSTVRSHIPFSEMEATQNLIQKYRESYTVQAVHLLIPSVAAQTSLKGDITLPFKVIQCKSSQPEVPPNAKILGEQPNNVHFEIKPNHNISEWQLTCLVHSRTTPLDNNRAEDPALLNLSLNDQSIPVANIAIGEFALSGTLFKHPTQADHIQILSPNSFLPADIPPQFRQPFSKAAYFWMEPYPSIPSTQGVNP